MNNELEKIKSAVINGGYIDNTDYYNLMHTARYGLTDDARDAQSILRTYNEYYDRGVYNYLNDPMRGVTYREEDNERFYGRLGTETF